MATYEITEYDKDLSRQQILELRGKFDVYDFDDNYLDSIEGGLISGNISINAESDIRRTLSVTLIPCIQDDVKIRDEGIIWLDKKIKFYIGIADMRTHEYTWYPQGTFVFMSGSSTYDAVTNQLQLECSDMMAFLDGTRNGTLGQLTIVYPAYQDYVQSTWIGESKATNVDALFSWALEQGDAYTNDITKCRIPEVKAAVWQLLTNDNLEGKVHNDYINRINEYLQTLNSGSKKHNMAVLDDYRQTIDKKIVTVKSIREYYIIGEQMATAVGQLGRVKKDKIFIGDIGEAKGMPGYSKSWDYQKYREDTPKWNTMPFDQEFASGTSVLNIVTTLRDLYENYEAFFDIYENFICQQIPSGDDDIITFDNSYLRDILINENTSLDFTEPKNMFEVWGKVLEPEFFAMSNVEYRENENLYHIVLEGYGLESCTGDIIAIKIPAANKPKPKLQIFSKDAGRDFKIATMYDDNNEVPLDSKKKEDATPTLRPGMVAVFRIYKKWSKDMSSLDYKAYYLGEWQPHAMEILSNGKLGSEYITVTNGVQVKKFSEEYFKEVYGCDLVNILIDEENPFVVQKIGEILSVKTDDNIVSESTCLETCHQELYRAARLTDNITLTTKICPFADVNQKVSYRPSDSTKTYEYIVKSLSHDIQGGTTSWTLMRYKRLYLLPDELLEGISKDDKPYWRK